MQGKSDAYWTLILVLMRYLPVLGAASVLPQRWCTPGAFGYHSHDILDRAQRAVDRVLVDGTRDVTSHPGDDCKHTRGIPLTPARDKS